MSDQSGGALFAPSTSQDETLCKREAGGTSQRTYTCIANLAHVRHGFVEGAVIAKECASRANKAEADAAHAAAEAFGMPLHWQRGTLLRYEQRAEQLNA